MDSVLNWKLDSLFGGRGSSRATIAEGLRLLEERLSVLVPAFTDPRFYLELQSVCRELTEASSLVACLTAQNTGDTEAIALESNVNALTNRISHLQISLENALKEMKDHAYETLFEDRALVNIKDHFDQMRRFARMKLGKEQEQLINALSVSGHDAMTTLYYTYMGEIEFDFLDMKMTLGQLENKLNEKDRNIRLTAMHSLEEGLTKKESIFGQLLNNILDFRNKVYRYRGWQEPLTDALHSNRISKTTLDTMWQVVQKNKPMLVRYLEKKASLLGLSRLSWCDFHAPLPQMETSGLSYAEGARFIVEQFSKVSQPLAKFAERAIDNRWIEAENRLGKRAGGFCIPCPIAGESRIFMNYANTMTSVGTLAHELGHAYHNEVLFNRPFFQQNIGMAIAETASTMCEMIVIDGAIRTAATQEMRQSLLDEKLSRAVAFSCDVHARYLFDLYVHEERTQCPLSPADFTALMHRAQREGYADQFDEYLDHFWSYKMHFYFTDVSFYNFPYTMGYLFSLGTYHYFMKNPEQFAKNYDALLQESGSMSLEDLARKHLHVDLSQPDFWQSAYDLIAEDVEAFYNA